MRLSRVRPSSNSAGEAKTLLPSTESITFLLDEPRVVTALVGGCTFTFLLLVVIVQSAFPDDRLQLPLIESTAAFGAACMLGGASVARSIALFTRRGMPGTHFSGTSVAVLAVAVLSAITNLLLAFMPTPVLLDPISHKPHHMMRWVQWIVLSFMLMFIVEAIDATSIHRPLAVASTQGMCVIAGLLLPLARGPLAWTLLLLFGAMGYGLVFQRVHARRLKVEQLTSLCGAFGGWSHNHSYSLMQTQVGLDLLHVCAWTWSLIFVEFLVSSVVHAQRGAFLAFDEQSSRDWGFVVECGLDVIAKLMYASTVHERVAIAPSESADARLRELHGRVSELWALSSDVFIASAAEVPRSYFMAAPRDAAGAALPELHLWAIASSSASRLIGEAEAKEWRAGANFTLARNAAPVPAPVGERLSGEAAVRAPAAAAKARELAALLHDNSPVTCDGLLGIITHAWRELLRAEQARQRELRKTTAEAMVAADKPAAQKAGAGASAQGKPAPSRQRLGASFLFTCILIATPRDDDDDAGGSADGDAATVVRVCEVNASLSATASASATTVLASGELGDAEEAGVPGRRTKRMSRGAPFAGQAREVMIVVRDLTEHVRATGRLDAAAHDGSARSGERDSAAAATAGAVSGDHGRLPLPLALESNLSEVTEISEALSRHSP